MQPMLLFAALMVASRVGAETLVNNPPPGTRLLGLSEDCSFEIYLYDPASSSEVINLCLPSETTGDIALKSSCTSGAAVVIKSRTYQAQLDAGQTCNTNGPASFYKPSGVGFSGPTKLDDHEFYATQSSLMRSTIQSNQVATYKALCNNVFVVVPVTCINGQVKANICFRAHCLQPL